MSYFHITSDFSFFIFLPNPDSGPFVPALPTSRKQGICPCPEHAAAPGSSPGSQPPSSARFVWDAGSPSQDLSAEVTLTSLCCHPAGGPRFAIPETVPGWSQPNQRFQVYRDPWEKSSGLPPFPIPPCCQHSLVVWKRGGLGGSQGEHPKGWDLGGWICLDFFLIVIIFSCGLWLKKQKPFFPPF